jgi:hypothetical protein
MSTLPGDPTSAIASSALPEAPYRGIEAFRFIDRQIFAARADEIWALLSNSNLYRAVLLYGDSGTGKSSLINAGLLPRAQAEGYVPDRLRIQPFAGREIKIERIRTSGPNESPVYLPSNFTGLEADGLPADGAAESIELSLTAFRQRLKQFRRSSGDAQPDALFRALGKTPRPLLIFDQFEEFVTLFEEAQRGGPTDEAKRIQQQAPRVQRRVLVTLIKLIRDETLPVKIVFSFREDYLAKLSLLFDHCPEVLDHALRLVPPRVEVLPEIIRAPFADPDLRAHFLSDHGQPRSELSGHLAGEIAAELGHQSTGEAVNLTELQIVCLRLWQSSNPEELFKSNGILGLLKSYGTDVFSNFTPELRDAAVALLGKMITASNTRNIIAEEDLLSRAFVGGEFQQEQLRAALGELARSQLVRREARRHLYFYEITSEYLVPWIKEQVAERKAIESQREAEAARYDALIEESKQRRTRLLTRLVAILVFLLASAVGFAWYAHREYKRADAANKAVIAANQDLRQLVDALSQINSENQDEKRKGIATLETLKNENKITADLATEVISKTVARLYVHIGNESQREEARQVADGLAKKGYIVAGIQNSGNRVPMRNELRYFRKDDPTAPKDIVMILNQATGEQWVESYTPGYENSSDIAPGHFEIWFGAAPGSPIGWLRAWPVDEKDNYVSGLPFFISVSTLSGNPIKRQRSGWLALPQGDYMMTASSEGYEQISKQFSITNGKETEERLKFIKKN